MAIGGFARYAIYWAPDPGPLADWAARWLGWDPAGGMDLVHPDLPALPRPVAEITATPRKYGFHGTVKPPFRLAEGTDAAELDLVRAALPDVPLVGFFAHGEFAGERMYAYTGVLSVLLEPGT